AAELAAEIVDRMHERRFPRRRKDGASVLEGPVVREDDVKKRAGELPGKAVDRLDRPAHPVIAQRDLAEQLAVVGQVDRGGVAAVRLDLADVVEQRPGDRDVAIDAGERGGDRADSLADEE